MLQSTPRNMMILTCGRACSRSIAALLLAVLTLMLGCTGNGTNGSNTSSDSTNWSHEALLLFRPMETHFFNGNVDSVEAAWPEVRDFCREHEVWWVYYAAWARKAEARVWNGDFECAAADAEAMRKDAESRGNGYGQAMAYYVMAQGYAVQDNYDEAGRCYQQAINYYPEDENPSMLTTIFATYSEVLALQGDYDGMARIEPQWKRILDSKPVTAGDPQAFVWASWRHPYFGNRFLRHYAHGQYDEAARDLDSAAYYNRLDCDTLRNASVLHRYRSQLANALKRYDEALTEADSAIADASDLGNAFVVGNLEQRAAALEGLGRYNEALADVRQMKSLNDSITQSDNREQLNLLNKRFEVAELQLQQQRTRSHLYLALAALALAVVALGFYMVYTRRIRKKNRKLYEQIMKALPLQPRPLPVREESDYPVGGNSVAKVSSPLPHGEGPEMELFIAISRLMTDERLYTNADLNRSDLVQRLGTNDHYLSDAIREGTGGQSLQQFVNGYRLQHAMRLLTTTADSIEQIAFASGFNSRQVFARVFRDEYGMSPSEFRRAARAEG